MTTNLAKAEIFRLDANESPILSEKITCLFNPTEYTFAKQNTWQTNNTPGNNMPALVFQSGRPATLKMQLLFDTFRSREDVRDKYTDPLWKLMLVDPQQRNQDTQHSEPPKVRFQWGRTWAFNAVITSMSQKFTLFLEDGTPVRAVVDVTFQQVRDTEQLRAQNPTSGGSGGERVWRVSPGDTLDLIAYRVYGDPNRWRTIAAHNHLKDVRRLIPGMELEIPNA